jgi:NAD+ kinase
MTNGEARARSREKIRRVVVLANFEKRAVRELAAELEPWLAERVEHVRLEPDILAFCRAREATPRGARETYDLGVVLGGDGAILGAVRAFAEDPVPTLGINLGRVGFLASVPVKRWRDTLESVFEGQGVLEHRARLRARWQSGGVERSDVALNDVVLLRGARHGMLTLALRVGSTWVTDYRADGVIVATPSGSTAYALSAGGPVLEPSVAALVVTPIASQGLSNRPIVLPGSAELSLEVVASSGETTLAFDSQTYHPLQRGDGVVVASHPVPYPLYALPDLDPYRRLRERLGWGGTNPAARESD